MSKRLSLEQIEQLKTMVQNGEKPEDIAKHFGVAISSVHNYKARFKAEGITFPNLRGQRPKGTVNTKAAVVKQPKTVTATPNKTPTSQHFDIVVNGVQISISGKAKNVSINPDRLEIDF